MNRTMRYLSSHVISVIRQEESNKRGVDLIVPNHKEINEETLAEIIREVG